MIALDEDSLLCDFAETYHIYDLYGLDVEYAATLASGLRDDSRIRLKANGLKVDTKTLLLARIADSTTLNVYAKTKDAQHNRNYPKSLVEAFLRDDNKDIRPFINGAEFDEEWRRISGN